MAWWDVSRYLESLRYIKYVESKKVYFGISWPARNTTMEPESSTMEAGHSIYCNPKKSHTETQGYLTRFFPG